MNTVADDVYVDTSQPDLTKMAIAESFLKLHLLPEIETEIYPDRLLRSLHAHAYECRPGTWRNRRNALAHYFNFADDVEFACDIKMMTNPVTDKDADSETKALKPKKQKRTHKVFDEEHEKVVRFLAEIDDQPVLGAITIARNFGIRPSEISSMVFNDAQQSIFVEGAKKREKGDRGIDRTLLLEIDDYLIAKESWSHVMSERDKKDLQPNLFMKRIQNRLYNHVRKVFNKRESYPSLYSYRHQLGSDLKASGMDRITIAAIMGHASVNSVDDYGDKRHGGRKMNIAVSDESLDAVKNVKVSTLPSHNDAQKPVKFSSDVTNTGTLDSFSDVSGAEDNKSPGNEKESGDTASPQPYMKMINGSKAIMF